MKIVGKMTALLLAGAALLSFAGCKDDEWKASSDISVISREDGSGTRSAFIELFGIEKKVDGKKTDFTTTDASVTNSTAVMLTTVAGDQYAIGYVSLGSLNDSVKALDVEGASASVENINNGSYKIARPFNVAVKDDLSASAKDFLNYILSDQGQNVIESNKYIKVSSGTYEGTAGEEKVVVSGSSSVSPVMEKLIEAYKEINPSANIELQTSDSTTGVQNAISGTCDIGIASRALKASELSEGVNEITIAMDGIAVIVNKANPLTSITKDQVESIFTGTCTAWNEIVK